MRSRKHQEKDLMVLREQDSAYEQHKSTRGSLKDYSLRHKVTMYWDMTEDSIRDQMVKLVVDDYEVILDAEEIMRLARWA